MEPGAFQHEPRLLDGMHGVTTPKKRMAAQQAREYLTFHDVPDGTTGMNIDHRCWSRGTRAGSLW